MAGEASRKNGKKGGRPKGKKSKATLEREAVLKAFRDKTMKAAGVLFHSQLSLARGFSYLYKIEKELQVGPRGGKKYVPQKPKLVTAQREIEAYLLGLVEDGDLEDNDPAATYYFIVTKDPSNQAADSLLNRLWGKAPQAIDLTNSDGSLKTVVINKNGGDSNN